MSNYKLITIPFHNEQERKDLKDALNFGCEDYYLENTMCIYINQNYDDKTSEHDILDVARKLQLPVTSEPIEEFIDFGIRTKTEEELRIVEDFMESKKFPYYIYENEPDEIDKRIFIHTLLTEKQVKEVKAFMKPRNIYARTEDEEAEFGIDDRDLYEYRLLTIPFNTEQERKEIKKCCEDNFGYCNEYYLDNTMYLYWIFAKVIKTVEPELRDVLNKLHLSMNMIPALKISVDIETKTEEKLQIVKDFLYSKKIPFRIDFGSDIIALLDNEQQIEEVKAFLKPNNIPLRIDEDDYKDYKLHSIQNHSSELVDKHAGRYTKASYSSVV